MTRFFLFCALTVAGLAGCQREQPFITQVIEDAEFQEWKAVEDAINLPVYGDNYYEQKLPAFLLTLGLRPATAPAHKAVLGRVLFYDKNLSRDRSTSCASCHKPERAFSDNVAQSRGIEGQRTLRNTPPLANVAHFNAHYASINGKKPQLMWDERAQDVSTQSRMTFANPHEMGMTMKEVVERVREAPYYAWLWKQAYGSKEVQEEQVLECLQHFVGSIGAYNTRLDKALAAVNGKIDSTNIINIYYVQQDTVTLDGSLTKFESMGLRLFTTHCSKCHSAIRTTQEVFAACNGLDMTYKDNGIGSLTNKNTDMGVFKSPSLRNIALTAPYMHDGRFNTLEEVVEFYSTGVKKHPNLHKEMRRKNGDTRLNLTAMEKRALVDFLNMLTDETPGNDKRFSDPFKH